MKGRERRGCQRYPLHYPVLLRIGGESGTGGEQHLAEVLDAGVNGMRLQLTNHDLLRAGREVTIFCQPARRRQADENWTVFELRCRVVWEDIENREVGLYYIN